MGTRLFRCFEPFDSHNNYLTNQSIAIIIQKSLMRIDVHQKVQ